MKSKVFIFHFQACAEDDNIKSVFNQFGTFALIVVFLNSITHIDILIDDELVKVIVKQVSNYLLGIVKITEYFRMGKYVPILHN